MIKRLVVAFTTSSVLCSAASAMPIPAVNPGSPLTLDLGQVAIPGILAPPPPPGHTVLTDGQNRASDPYRYRNDPSSAWEVRLQPNGPEYIAAFTPNATQALTRAFPNGWNFMPQPAPQLSAGSLRVHTYDPHYGSTIWEFNPPYWGRFSCPDASKPDSSGYCRVVGAEFAIEYRPAGTDPLNGIHWIQIVDSSDTPTQVDQGDPRFPYYDFPGGSANDRALFDWPTRGWGVGAHPFEVSWNAELYLVQAWGDPLTRKTNVQVLGGLDWGWVNMRNEAPEPSTLSLVALALLAVVLSSYRSFARSP